MKEEMFFQSVNINGLILLLYVINIQIYVTALSRPTKNTYNREMISSGLIVVTDYQTPSGYITSPNYPSAFPTNTSSRVVFMLNGNSTRDTIKIEFEHLDLEVSNFCEGESIKLIHPSGRPFDQMGTSRTNYFTIFHTICGSLKPEPIVIRGVELTIVLTSDPFSSGKSRGFKLKFQYLTSDRLHTGCESPNMFRCQNRRCIDNKLICNKVDNCGDASDEDVMTPCRDLPTIPYKINYECGLAPNFPIDIKSSDNNQDKLSEDLIHNRIVGGQKLISSARLPFQVSFQHSRYEPAAHFCGGTLIHPLFVLSAVHCLKNIRDFRIVLGSRDLSTGSREIIDQHVQVRYAVSAALYPGISVDLASSLGHYDISNDLALIELNAPVVLNQYVWPACLPHLGEQLVAGRKCYVSGFGETRGTGNPLALKVVDQIVQHRNQCQPRFEQNFHLDDYTMICARSPSQSNGPCGGDSGGPLLCVDRSSSRSSKTYKPGELIRYLTTTGEDDQDKTNDIKAQSQFGKLRYTVHGVTSFATDGSSSGAFCGLKTVPTIYARLSTKVEWILSKLRTFSAAAHLNREDMSQDQHNRATLFGYMFRSGSSRHVNLTRLMTIYNVTNVEI